MSTIPRRIPARYIQILMEIVRETGIDIELLLREVGVNSVTFFNKDTMLLPSQVDAIIKIAQQMTGRTDLGFELGRRIKVNSHNLLGYGLMSCSTMDEFLVMASRHYHLMTETWFMNYRRWYSGGECVYTPATAITPETMLFYLEVLAIAHQNQCSSLIEPEQHGYDIYLSMKQPPHINRYLALTPVRFHFNEEAPLGVRIVMGADLLNTPLRFGNPAVMQQISDQCDTLVTRPAKSDIDWPEYLIMMLRNTNNGQITLEELARQIKVSPRTIDRHLKKAGLGFRDLSNKVRFEQASELLCQKGMTVAQVALRLGFTDTANFSRAFRREFGISPSEFQRNAGLT